MAARSSGSHLYGTQKIHRGRCPWRGEEMTNDSSNVRSYNKEKKIKKQNKIKIYTGEHAYSSGVFILFVQRLHTRVVYVYVCERRNQNPLYNTYMCVEGLWVTCRQQVIYTTTKIDLSGPFFTVITKRVNISLYYIIVKKFFFFLNQPDKFSHVFNSFEPMTFLRYYTFY